MLVLLWCKARTVGLEGIPLGMKRIQHNTDIFEVFVRIPSALHSFDVEFEGLIGETFIVKDAHGFPLSFDDYCSPIISLLVDLHQKSTKLCRTSVRNIIIPLTVNIQDLRTHGEEKGPNLL